MTNFHKKRRTQCDAYVNSPSIYIVNVSRSSRDPELVKRIGEATALEVRATGIPYVFAPCIAVMDNILGC